ncbi:MAG: hypothetical protein R8K50_01845 [Mariprofundus sp.]
MITVQGAGDTTPAGGLNAAAELQICILGRFYGSLARCLSLRLMP